MCINIKQKGKMDSKQNLSRYFTFIETSEHQIAIQNVDEPMEERKTLNRVLLHVTWKLLAAVIRMAPE